MRNLNYLNDKRIDLFGDGFLGDEHNGAFKINYQGSFYNVIASNGRGWEHVSVSNNQRIPSWEVMCKIKEMFFEDTNLKLTLISEDIKSYYTVRQLELENVTVSTATSTNQILQSL